MWVEAEDTALLVDCGLSGKELKRRIVLAGLDPDKLAGIMVSHEHRDHILGVGVAARAFSLPVYINEGALNQAGPGLGRINPIIIDTGKPLTIDPLRIHPFSVSHDCRDPLGFTFDHQGTRLGLATDLGVATALVKEHLSGCRALILEANHDPQMLMDGPYPWETKRRVKSRQGHLSNFDAAELLVELDHKNLAGVVLAHLSETNNNPELALEAVRAVINRQDQFLRAAKQNEPGPIFNI